MSTIVVNALVKKLTKANTAYRVGTPVMTDEAYDRDIALLRKLDPSNVFLKTVEPAPAINDRGEIIHPHPMLSTDKAYTQEELVAFVNRVLSLKSQLLTDWTEDTLLFRVTPKLDGIAARYYPGALLATRGDGSKGSNISFMLEKGVTLIKQVTGYKLLKDVPMQEGCLDGELVIPKQYFSDFLSADFAYPRNVVAGLASAKYLNDTHENLFIDQALHFAAYDHIPHYIVSGKMLCDNIDYYFDALTKGSDYVCDGIIIEVTPEMKQVRAMLGSNDTFHKYMLAYKKKGECAETVVRGVTWQVGRTGTITPVLEIDATQLTGSVIRRVTGHNLDYMLKHNLGINARISITRAGDVIPKHEETLVEGDSLDIPKQCPCCKSFVTVAGVNIACTNHNLLLQTGPVCTDQVIQSLSHFFQSLGNADLLGDKTLSKILAAFPKITSVSEVLILTVEQLAFCGLGPTQSKNVYAQLQRAMTSPVEDYVLLASFGLPMLGMGNAKKLLKVIPWTPLITESTEEKIKAIRGFDSISAKIISEALHARGYDILRTRELMQDVRSTPAPTQSALTGKHVCFTGSFEGMKRQDIEKQAEGYGAIVQSAVNKKTNYLISGSALGASKKQAAEKNGTEVLSYEQYVEMLET